MKCVDLLITEHKMILVALSVLDAMALRVEQGEPVVQVDVETLLHFLRTFADNHHQGKEETALFPEVMKFDAAEIEPVRHMIFEHNQERSLVEGLEDALRTKAGKNFVVYANRLTGLLRNHIYKEDHILFEAIEKALSADQDRCISTEFHRMDRLHENKIQEALRDLRRLEWIYLRKRPEATQVDGVSRESIRSDTR